MRNQSQLWDDPMKDYRQRYMLPDQFIWDIADLARIDFDGYMSVVLSLLPKPPAQILDAGCGPGLGAKLMCEQKYNVVGIDYNKRGIEFAKILVAEAEFLNLDLRLLGDIEEFRNRFDAVTMVEVIEHIPPEFHSDVIKGIYDVLCPKGTLVLAVPTTRMPLNRWDYKHFELEELLELLRANGLKPNKVVYQHRLSWLFSGRTWQMLTNRYYDLRFIRYILRPIFLNSYNTTNNPSRAGRIIVQAEKL